MIAIVFLLLMERVILTLILKQGLVVLLEAIKIVLANEN